MAATSLDFIVPSLPGRGLDAGYARTVPGPGGQVGGGQVDGGQVGRGEAGVRHVDAPLPAPHEPIGDRGAQFGLGLVLAVGVVAVIEVLRRRMTGGSRYATREDAPDPYPRSPATEEAIRQAFLARYGRTPT